MKKSLVILVVSIFIISCSGMQEKFQEKKVETTMKDMNILATTLANYVMMNGFAPKQDGIITKDSEFYNALIREYMPIIPINDGWGENLRVYCGIACNGKYGISGASDEDFLLVSFGRDKEMESWEYNPYDEEIKYVTIFSVDDYDKDIINYNALWIRFPLYKAGKELRRIRDLLR